MDSKRYIYILVQKGQSSVEYLLLFVVVVSLTFAVLKSDAFQNFFGDQGQFATTYKNEIEFSYTNSYQGRKAFETPNYTDSNHPSYNGTNGSETRFFGAAEEYPSQ